MRSGIKKILSSLKNKNKKQVLEDLDVAKKLTPKKQTDFSAGSPGGAGVGPLDR